MKLYKHETYEKYVEAQVNKNTRKIKLVWVKSGELSKLANKIKILIPKVKFGICHGVRNAWEVAQLRRLLKIKVIGTDIAPSATNFKDTIQWDFHKIKSEWKNSVDFIYSNSFDHSYDPEMCLDRWMKCIRKGRGVCFIHWMSTNADKIDSADCFAGTIQDYRKLINKRYRIIEEYGKHGRTVFVIKHQENG